MVADGTRAPAPGDRGVRLACLEREAPVVSSWTEDAAFGGHGSEAFTSDEMHGVRAGAVMFAGVAVVNIGNYVFHLIAARDLGPSDYGDLVALLTLSALICLPLTALQVVVGRYVAQFAAVGNPSAAHRLNRRVAVGTGSFAIVAMVVIAAFAPLVERWLSIASGWAVVLTAVLTLPSALTPVVWGVVQGLQRFTLLAVSMAVGSLARIVPLVIFVAIGLSTPAAIFATLVGVMASVSLPLVRFAGWFRKPLDARTVAESASVRLLRSSVPVMVALVAFTSLTQSDVLAANASLSDTASGVYGAASLIGRVVLYLPAAIVAVLLPKVAARSASDRPTVDILGLSLLATFAFCAASTLVYGAVPGTIVRVAFGAKYEDAADLLLPFGIAMTALALVNVLLYYHLGRGHSSFAWILGAGAVTQVAAFAAFHSSPRILILDTIVVSTLILVAHEAVTRGTMTAAARHALVAVGRRLR
jgi:O-antigen/teichoic acid export membrane protein